MNRRDLFCLLAAAWVAAACGEVTEQLEHCETARCAPPELRVDPAGLRHRFEGDASACGRWSRAQTIEDTGGPGHRCGQCFP